jgi:hypothetical protein
MIAALSVIKLLSGKTNVGTSPRGLIALNQFGIDLSALRGTSTSSTAAEPTFLQE